MHRLLILIGVIVAGAACAQGVGDYAFLENPPDEKRFVDFLSKARADGDSAAVVVIYSLWGRWYTKQQQYDRAERLLLHAAELLDKQSGQLRTRLKLTSLSIYDVYDNLAELYDQTADYHHAEYFFQLSETKRAQAFSRGSYYRIYTLQNLCSFYLHTRRWKSAEIKLRQLGAELDRTRFNNEKLRESYAVFYKGMTLLSIELQNRKEAEFYFRQAVKFYAGPFSSYSGAVRRGINDDVALLYGRLLLLQGKTDEARNRLSSLARSPQLDSLRLLPECLRTLARSYDGSNDKTAAFAASRNLLQLDIRNVKRIFPFLNDGEKERFSRDVARDLDQACVWLADQPSLQTEENLAMLFQFRMQTKSMLLNESRKLKHFLESSADSSVRRSFQLLAQLKNEQAIEAFRKGSRQRLERLEEQKDALEKQLYFQLPATAVAENLTARRLQSALDEHSAAIEVIRFRRDPDATAAKDSIHYLMLIVEKEKMKAVVLENGSELEGRYLTYYRNVMKSDPDTVCYHVYWRRVENQLSGVQQIYFSGDGVYHQLNLSTLFAGHEFMVDRYDWMLLSHLSDVMLPSKSLTSGKAVLFGRPDYTLKESLATESSALRSTRALTLGEIREEQFVDLPGTETEVEKAAQMLTTKQWTATVYLGAKASEANVKRLAHPDVLHIATHGFFLNDQAINNPMLKSGLIFAGVRNADQVGEDGILTALEASDLRLDNTALVVLSACETGLGESHGGEGIYGLQRSFRIAGARLIIMSLWKVDDEATQKLMDRFYAHWTTNGDVRSAFTAAQRELRSEYSSPYFWGAFELIGK